MKQICPRCASPLRRARIAGQPFECCDECGGRATSDKVLRRVVALGLTRLWGRSPSAHAGQRVAGAGADVALTAGRASALVLGAFARGWAAFGFRAFRAALAGLFTLAHAFDDAADRAAFARRRTVLPSFGRPLFWPPLFGRPLFGWPLFRRPLFGRPLLRLAFRRPLA